MNMLLSHKCRQLRPVWFLMLMVAVAVACAMPQTVTPVAPSENPATIGAPPSQEPHPSEQPSSEVQITFAASHSDLKSGECTTLIWSVQGGFGVTLNNQPVEHSGQKEVCPPETTTYSLDVDAGDRMERRQVVIQVGGEPAPLKTQPVEPTTNPDKPNSPGCPGAPVFSNFTANPNTINAGQPSTLSWGNVTNGASGPLVASLKLEPGLGEVGSGASSRIVKPTQTTTYTLTATGCGGTAMKQVTVTVGQQLPVATLIPLPSIDLEITDLYADQLPSGKVYTRITNNGPQNASDVEVLLICEAVRTEYSGGAKTTFSSTRNITVNLNAGQTQAFDTKINIEDSTKYWYKVGCLTKGNSNDPKPNNTPFIENIPPSP